MTTRNLVVVVQHSGLLINFNFKASAEFVGGGRAARTLNDNHHKTIGHANK